MDLNVRDRTALVTASSGGIGSCIVEALAAEGCSVIVHGRDEANATSVLERVRAAGGHATMVLGDLSDDQGFDEVAALVSRARPDILVNNAGPFSEHTWDDVDAGDWRAAWEGNVLSAARLTQQALGSMRERGWGRIITLGSRAATTPLPNMVEYSAAKAAVVNLTTSLARHLAGTGVTANCVSPGVILTPSLQKMFLERGGGQDWSTLEPTVTADYAPNPSGRLGRGEDIAAAVAFLASDLAGYVNGIDLRVDGGITGTP